MGEPTIPSTGVSVIVEAVIGDGFALSGEPITMRNVHTALTAQVGVIALVEPVLEIVLDESGLFLNYSG